GSIHGRVEGRTRHPDRRVAGRALALAEKRDRFGERERSCQLPQIHVDAAHQLRRTYGPALRQRVALRRIDQTCFHRYLLLNIEGGRLAPAPTHAAEGGRSLRSQGIATSHEQLRHRTVRRLLKSYTCWRFAGRAGSDRALR